MRAIRRHWLCRVVAAFLSVLTVTSSGPVAWAASHREAPLIALDPAADLTDVYLFRSHEANKFDRVVAIMNVIPGQEPSSGPNYFNFDPNVLYAFNFDANADGNAEDLVVEFRFTQEIRSPFDDLPISYGGVDPVPGLPPAITALDGPGSTGLGLRQRYTVTVKRGGAVVTTIDRDTSGRSLFAVPSNVGPRTMPNYEALAAQGVFDLGSGVRVFAGQRDETFYIDLGATFDTLNFRRNPPVLTNAEDANDGANPFGIDMFSGFNINTIAIEAPIALFQQVTNSTPQVIGMYASTSRQQVTTQGVPPVTSGPFVQVSRMANPLVNELIIGTGMKDRWNATDPEDEAQFLGFYQGPRLAALLGLAFGIALPPAPRNDLVSVLLKYPGQSPSDCSSGNPCSELLRLNLSVTPTPSNQIRRLTVLAHDAAGNPTPDMAGWPNGRRPDDDVTDIALRVVAGVISGNPCCTGSPHNRLGDGVNFNIGAPGTTLTANNISFVFPFLPTPHDGRDRRHLDPGE